MQFQPMGPATGHCLCEDCVRQRPERRAELDEFYKFASRNAYQRYLDRKRERAQGKRIP